VVQRLPCSGGARCALKAPKTAGIREREKSAENPQQTTDAQEREKSCGRNRFIKVKGGGEFVNTLINERKTKMPAYQTDERGCQCS